MRAAANVKRLVLGFDLGRRALRLTRSVSASGARASEVVAWSICGSFLVIPSLIDCCPGLPGLLRSEGTRSGAQFEVGEFYLMLYAAGVVGHDPVAVFFGASLDSGWGVPLEQFRRYQGAEIGDAFGEHPAVQLSRYDARWALRSRASSPAPSIRADFRRRRNCVPIRYTPGEETTPPSWRIIPLRSRTGSSSQE